ncbi:hypothetical protein [Geminisphaera colitermitum]|uniref:hypothetical protein n=1 Tax=Geminisphaera colitermitum TaxID=1148786 RepID=UPI000158C818|nr:hypothetical protein [Geminisphaera colitermitum]
MSDITDKTPVKLPVGVWLALLVTVGGALSSFAVAQYQIAEHSRRISALEEQGQNSRELLLRIDERTTEIKRQLDRMTARNP